VTRNSTEHALAAVLLAAVVVLPIVFDPNLDDGYALPKVSILRILGFIGAALYLLYVASRGPLARFADRSIDIPLACFVGLLVAASVASVDPLQSFAGEPYQYQGLVTVLLYVGSFHLARLSLGSAEGFRRILMAIVVTGAVVAIYGIAQSLGLDPFQSSPPPDGRIISSVGQANDLATYLGGVMIAAFGLWPGARRPVRVALGGVAFVSLVALALTFSRGGYIGLAVGLGVLLVPQHHRLPRRWAAALALTVGGILAVGLWLPHVRAIAERVIERAVASADLGEGSIRFHLDQWRVGAQIAIEHPLLGTGPETFPLAFRPYLDQVLTPDRAEILGRFRLESPHNEFLGIAAEMGLPALVAYVVFLLASAWVCIRHAAVGGTARSMALVVLAVLTSHVAVNSFKTPDVTTSEIFWITMGAGLAAIRDRDGRLRSQCPPRTPTSIGGPVRGASLFPLPDMTAGSGAIFEIRHPVACLRRQNRVRSAKKVATSTIAVAARSRGATPGVDRGTRGRASVAGTVGAVTFAGELP
jgi:O-antigen ligase